MALDAFDSSAANGFIVTVDGIQIPKVNEVSGLKSEVDKIELKQQTSDGKYVVRQLIGRAKAGEFTVTRGLTDSKTITDWLKTVAQGDVAGARKTASVQLLEGATLDYKDGLSAGFAITNPNATRTCGCGSSFS